MHVERDGDGGTGSARRRRQRRLRSFLRPERMAVAMALAESLHHSANVADLRKKELVEHAQYNAPRGQKTARAVGGRPAPLPEVADWQERLEQRAVEDLGSICPYVQILDLPVLQMVEQSVEVDTFFRLSLPAVAEQVIEVPKISCPSHAGRAALREPQLVEHLVEVPTVLTYSLLKQRTAEQVVDTPVSHGRGRGARGGPQGSSQGHGSTAVCGADEVVSPALHARGGGFRGGFHGLSQGQGSTADCGADFVVSPALHGRSVLSSGGLQGLSQGQGSPAFGGAFHEDTPVPHGRGEGARGGLHGFSSGHQSGQRSAEQNVDIPAPSFRSRRARRTAEQNVDIPVRRSRAHGGLQDFSPGQSSSQRTVPGVVDDLPARLGTVLVASGDTPGVIRADDGQRLRFQLPSWFHIPVGRRVSFRAEEGDWGGTAYGVSCWDD